MAITTTPLGFKKPDGNELVRGGDNSIADNAQKAQDLIAAAQSATATLTGRVANAEQTVGGHGTRIGAVETRVTTAQTDLAGMSNYGTRLGSFESQIAGLSAQVGSVLTPFNIGLDIDGVPFFQDGASGLSLEADTDGVPYFI